MIEKQIKILSESNNKEDLEKAIELYNNLQETSIVSYDIYPIIYDILEKQKELGKFNIQPIINPLFIDSGFIRACTKNSWGTGVLVFDDTGNEYSLNDVGSDMYGQFHLRLDISKVKGGNLVKGDLFDTKCQVIAHAVNCMGVMGSGVAKQVRMRYPEVYEKYKSDTSILQNNCLGGCGFYKVDSDKYIANLYTQYYYKGYYSNSEDYLRQDFWKQPELNYQLEPIRFTNYEAVWNSLKRLKSHLKQNNLNSVAFPYKMCSDRGGADWNIIEGMINSIFNDGYTKIEIRKI